MPTDNRQDMTYTGEVRRTDPPFSLSAIAMVHYMQWLGVTVDYNSRVYTDNSTMMNVVGMNPHAVFVTLDKVSEEIALGEFKLFAASGEMLDGDGRVLPGEWFDKTSINMSKTITMTPVTQDICTVTLTYRPELETV